MKKTLLLLVALITATIAFAYDAEIDGIYYDFDYENMTAKVTFKSDGLYYVGYKETEEIIIPEKVTYNSTEYSVTSIGKCAFYECKSLTSITIPNSVTSIGKDAFIRCSSLTSITIPNSVTSIGEKAFYQCSSLTSITIPSSVTLIGISAFEETPWLENQPDGCVYINNSLYVYKGEMPENTHIDVKNGTTQICGLAFYGRSSLASITIPNSVTSIEEMTFAECSSLTSIIIPNSVTSIDAYAFAFSSSLSSITIPSSITSMSGDAFEGTAWFNNQPDGCVYINNNILYAYKGEMPENTHIDINEGTTIICEVAFHSCSSLTSISIPNSVTSIGESAFSYCSSLTSITIPNNVTSIENTTFFSCSSLSSITIPNSITSIGEYAFSGCKSLTSLTIPNSVTYIGEKAFNGCLSLTSITCLGSTPPEASDLKANTSTCTLIVPKVAYSSYLRHAYWGQFLNIETIDVDYKKLTAIANNAEWGVVEGGGYYDNGDETTLTATANSGYRFVKWSDEVTDNPRTVVVTQDSTFTAIFEANLFAITTAVNDDAMGSVTEGGEYAYGTEITLTATANSGYRFTQWSDGNTDNPRIVTVTENKTYTAEFEVETFTITTASEMPSMGGVEVILNAKPIEGFEFVEWTDGNTDNPRILTLTENIEVYARFQIAQGGNPVDLETSKISSANIYTTNGTLHIEGATENYHILDAAGRLIYSGNATTLTLPRGIYLVTINGEVEKIVL